MKRLFFLFLLLIMLVSCKIPKLVLQDDGKYKIIDWEGGEFAYVTYIWEGGKFDDAIELIEEFGRISDSRGFNERAIGRFPTGKEWQLGLLINKSLDIEEINGYEIRTMTIPGGQYASLHAKGYPEYIFFFWKKLKKWLEKDGYSVESPVFEIYDGFFENSISAKNKKGEIRYRISR